MRPRVAGVAAWYVAAKKLRETGERARHKGRHAWYNPTKDRLLVEFVREFGFEELTIIMRIVALEIRDAGTFGECVTPEDHRDLAALFAGLEGLKLRRSL